MAEHPIQGLMGVTIEKIRDMVDTSTIIGDPIHVDDTTTIIPVSRVTFGLALIHISRWNGSAGWMYRCSACWCCWRYRCGTLPKAAACRTGCSAIRWQVRPSPLF